jgi:hypothetical protein
LSTFKTWSPIPMPFLKASERNSTWVTT